MPENSLIDPRIALIRTKYYTHLPDPLFDLFVTKRISRSALLVFLVYWKAGMINGDFCAEIPIETVAQRCGISTSAVTRAYQVLARHKLISRVDPGRDTSRPFNQAVAVTEIRLPESLVSKLSLYPDRRAQGAELESASGKPSTAEANASRPTNSAEPNAHETAVPIDPLAGFTGKARIAAQAELLRSLSKAERIRYDEAFYRQHATMVFDADSKLCAEKQQAVRQLLALLARPKPAPVSCSTEVPRTTVPAKQRRLSLAEIARVRHGVIGVKSGAQAEETVREIVWSVEQGALTRFTTLHAIRIALKKLREGGWSRPHRMPPNWVMSLAEPLRTSLNKGSRSQSQTHRTKTSPPDAASGTRPPIIRPNAVPAAGPTRLQGNLVAWKQALTVTHDPSYAFVHKE